MRTLRWMMLAAVAGGLLACGGGGGGSKAPTAAPSNPYQITITPSGAYSPTTLSVPAGARVLVTNNHSASHYFASDPHPEHDDCPEINQVGLLAPGESRETGNLVTVRTCGVHDHNDASNPKLHAQIIIH
jgi:hypothetical protein